MKKSLNIFFILERYLCAYLIFQMMAIIFIATFCRYTGIFPLSWGEELARFTMVWLVFIGSGIGSFSGLHFNVDVILVKLPYKLQKYCLYARMIILYGFCLFTIYYGVYIVQRQITSGQISAALHIPMWFMYSAVPIGALMVLTHYTGYSIGLFNKLNNKIQESEKEGGTK